MIARWIALRRVHVALRFKVWADRRWKRATDRLQALEEEAAMRAQLDAKDRRERRRATREARRRGIE